MSEESGLVFKFRRERERDAHRELTCDRECLSKRALRLERVEPMVLALARRARERRER